MKPEAWTTCAHQSEGSVLVCQVSLVVYAICVLRNRGKSPKKDVKVWIFNKAYLLCFHSLSRFVLSLYDLTRNILFMHFRWLSILYLPLPPSVRASLYSNSHEFNVIFLLVINTSCPKSKSERINWPRESFGVLSKRKCPFGSIGVASRMCAFHDGWQDPDLSDCVSQAIVDISNTVSAFLDNILKSLILAAVL